MAYALLVTYQVYYLIDRLGTAEAAVPHQISSEPSSSRSPWS